MLRAAAMDADDARQEAALALWRHGQRPECHDGYRRMVVRGRLIDAARRGIGARVSPVFCRLASVEHNAVTDRMVDPWIWGHVSRLPARQRDVLTARYRQGERFTETAERVGVSASAIGKRHELALEALRRRLRVTG